MNFRELCYDNMDWIRLVNITIQQCTLMSRVMIHSACVTDRVYLQ
jgi:hypothetical protein